MWPNPRETADLVTFTEEILNGKLRFLCMDIIAPFISRNWNLVQQHRSLSRGTRLMKGGKNLHPWLRVDFCRPNPESLWQEEIGKIRYESGLLHCKSYFSRRIKSNGTPMSDKCSQNRNKGEKEFERSW